MLNLPGSKFRNLKSAILLVVFLGVGLLSVHGSSRREMFAASQNNSRGGIEIHSGGLLNRVFVVQDFESGAATREADIVRQQHGSELRQLGFEEIRIITPAATVDRQLE